MVNPMTIDASKSFRKGRIISVAHVTETISADNTVEYVVTHQVTDHKSINKAKKANRQTQYRVVRS